MWIEASRTTIGQKLLDEGMSLAEVCQRVETRIDEVLVPARDSGLATVRVSVRIDGGEWMPDGVYLAR